MIYDTNAPGWGDPELGPTQYSSDTPNEQAKTQLALASNYMSPEEIRLIRPPMAQGPLFPARTGYGHPVIDVEDCVSASRDNGQRYDFSGTQAGFTGSSVASMGMW